MTQAPSHPAELAAGKTAPPARRAPWVTVTLTLLMLAVTVLALSKSSTWVAVDKQVLFEFGSSAAVVTLDAGGLWRLLAAKFQLGSIVMVVLFLPFFFAVASSFERIYGRFAALAVFIAVSILTSAFSMHVRGPFDLTSGAGGPTLAFFACIAVLALRRGDAGPGWSPRRTLLVSALIGSPYLLFVGKGLISRVADHGSLGSGIACGLLCGLVLTPQSATERSIRATGIAAMLAAALLAGATLVVFMAPEPPYYYSEAEALRAAGKRFEVQFNAIFTNFDEPVRRTADEDRAPRELAAEIEARELKGWTDLSRALQELPDKPQLPDIAYLKPMRDYASARIAFLTATIRGWRTDDEKWFIEANAHRQALLSARLELQRAGGKLGNRAVSAAAFPTGTEPN